MKLLLTILIIRIMELLPFAFEKRRCRLIHPNVMNYKANLEVRADKIDIMIILLCIYLKAI